MSEERKERAPAESAASRPRRKRAVLERCVYVWRAHEPERVCQSDGDAALDYLARRSGTADLDGTVVDRQRFSDSGEYAGQYESLAALRHRFAGRALDRVSHHFVAHAVRVEPILVAGPGIAQRKAQRLQ